jgi:microcystin-dependent protein
VISFVIYSSGVFFYCFLFFGGDCVAYNDLVTDVASFTTQASAASTDLAGIVSGADVLATQFDSLKSTVDSLSIALNELTGGQYTVLKDTAAARPATPSTGQLFFASDTKALSLYGGSWGAVCPTGIVSPFAGATAPEGWLLCDGTAVSRSTYAALFALVSTTYGVGDGSTTFNVPNLKGRTVIGVGLGVDAIPVTGVIGVAQGAATVTLTSAESGLPAHAHSVTNFNTVDGAGNHTHTINADQNNTPRASGGSDVNKWFDSGASRSTNAAGAHNHNIPDHNTNNNTAANAASAHTNIQPSLPLNYIIKV